jgi:hypothetical protein
MEMVMVMEIDMVMVMVLSKVVTMKDDDESTGIVPCQKPLPKERPHHDLCA